MYINMTPVDREHLKIARWSWLVFLKFTPPVYLSCIIISAIVFVGMKKEEFEYL